MKKAFITGITGQDGSYLSELLLKKNYEVHATIMKASTFNTLRIAHLYQDPHDPNRKLFLYYYELTDSSNISRLLEKIKPAEIYNLAAQSHVAVSFDMPEYTPNVVALRAMRLLDVKRDWCYAIDYVEGMWRMLQANEPDDYVLATDTTHTVREFVEECCSNLGINMEWSGKGVDEKGIDLDTGRTIVQIDPHYFRPAEVDLLIGDYFKAQQKQVGI